MSSSRFVGFLASEFLVYWKVTIHARSIFQLLNFENVDMSEPHSQKLAFGFCSLSGNNFIYYSSGSSCLEASLSPKLGASGGVVWR